jgi:phosphoribosylanthranilate isomerase
MLAGGLTPDNVAEAVRQARPFAVDVASGVEASPGVKDPYLVRAFVTNAKSA